MAGVGDLTKTDRPPATKIVLIAAGLGGAHPVTRGGLERLRRVLFPSLPDTRSDGGKTVQVKMA